jgi:hypothetical protein
LIHRDAHTMRQIRRGNATLNVVAHVILSNMWEYYITELPDANGVGWALVVGDYTEYGTVTQYDIDKHGISTTTQLGELLPPPEWAWCDGVPA